MNRNIMTTLLIILGLILSLGFSDELNPTVTLTLSNLDNGEAVDASITVKNIAQADATLTYETSHTAQFDAFRVSVVDENARDVPYTEEGKKHFDPLNAKTHRGSSAALTLSPSETFSFDLPIGKYFDLSKPGTYVVRIHPEKLVWIGDKPIPTDISVRFQVHVKDSH